MTARRKPAEPLAAELQAILAEVETLSAAKPPTARISADSSVIRRLIADLGLPPSIGVTGFTLMVPPLPVKRGG